MAFIHCNQCMISMFSFLRKSMNFCLGRFESLIPIMVHLSWLSAMHHDTIIMHELNGEELRPKNPTTRHKQKH